MTQQKLISVIIPVFNAAAHIANCIESLLRQTYSNLEIILINDGSTDNSRQMCEKYASADKRILLINTENSGAYSARNKGLSHANGDYIGFADADDTLEPDMYEYLIGKAEAYNADLVQCATFIDFENESSVINSPKQDIVFSGGIDSANKNFFSYLSFSTWSKLYKKELIDGISYKPFIIGEDLRFNMDALSRARCAVLLSEPKYHYVQRETSICYTPPNEEKLMSFRLMLQDAARDFAHSHALSYFIKSTCLINNTDIISKAVRFKMREEELIPLLSREARESLGFILFKGWLPLKSRAKLTLLALFPGIYKRLLNSKE